MTSQSTPDLTSSGPAISPGPTRRLRESVVNLVDKLDLSTSDGTKYGRLLLIFTEIMLIAGAASRILSLYVSGQLDQVGEVLHIRVHLLNGEKLEIKHTLENTIHMVTSTVIHLFLLPQLYILVVTADEKLTQTLQLVLAVLVMVLTLVTQTIGTLLKNKIPDNPDCTIRGTCLHSYMAWVLFITIIAFLLVIFIRFLFNMRCRSLIVGFKIVGPLIEFVVSRRSKDFLSLMLILILMMTSLSGMILHTKQLYSTHSPEEIEASVLEILLDLGSAMLCLISMLCLVLVYFHSHTIISHTKLVSGHRLDMELASLGERHRQVLTKDTKISKIKYCPVSRSAQPVRSPQLLGTK